nr:hypothetical protein [Pyrinomonadaceae bacterium]
MNFWHNVQTAAGPVGLHWLIPLFLAAVVLLFIYVPAERSRLRNSVYLFALAFGGLCAAALIGQGGAGYGWVRWTALFLLWVSIINVASVLVFNVLLEAVRL